MINNFFDNAEKEHAENDNKGGGVSRTHRLKMRLVNAFFDDEHRDDLIHLGASKSRVALDARNSEVRLMTFFEKVAEKYNDETWNTHSEIFPELYPEFCKVHDLCLYTEIEKVKKQNNNMTVEKVKLLYTAV